MDGIMGASAPVYSREGAFVYKGDCTDPASFGEGFFDLCVTSPPYNLDISYASTDDSKSYGDYLLFTERWLSNTYRWGRDGARLCLNIPLETLKDGHRNFYADVTSVARDCGWKFHNSIVWDNNNLRSRTAWGSWMSASAPNVMAPVEMIAVMYKGDEWRREGGTSDIGRKEFIDWTLGSWRFNGETAGVGGHPAPFPMELPRRCVKLFSFVGDTVFDPFSGSGTTVLAAALSGRTGVGLELDGGYCEMSAKRIDAALSARQEELFSVWDYRRSAGDDAPAPQGRKQAVLFEAGR